MQTDGSSTAHRLGIVLIGRNEAERLPDCLRSATVGGAPAVYVDSGSTDGSQELARSMGVEVVDLDLSIPFTAARARNDGFRRLLEKHPELELVQFVDGDCELVHGWLERAVRELEARPDVAVVCGRRSERFRDASIYNRLCDLEWNTPIGETDTCGGDAVMRASAFRAVDGYDPTLIAGEEPDLCFRLRRKGWKILRVDADMTLHDAAMTRFGQWWSRSRRAGHAAAEALAVHLRCGDARAWRRVRSIAFWAGALPLTIVTTTALALWTDRRALGAAVLATALAAYAALFLRIYLWRRRKDSSGDALLYSIFCILGKWPELGGVLLFLRNRWRGRRSELIEYKSTS